MKHIISIKIESNHTTDQMANIIEDKLLNFFGGGELEVCTKEKTVRRQIK